MKTFNKKGDEGETSLLFGRRIAKNSLRCEAYGTIDEAVSCLGIARNFVTGDKTKDVILKVQKELFTVSAELAVECEEYGKFRERFNAVSDEMVDRLETTIVELESGIDLPRSFIIPGSNAGSAWLDLSRAIIRRAERRVLTLKQSNGLSSNTVLHYLNRLADLLFILARYEESKRK